MDCEAANALAPGGSSRSPRPAGRQPVTAAVVLLSAAIGDAAAAGEIYRWVDADGGVHYSDSKPLDETPVTVLEIESAQSADYDPVEDPYSILNQAARIHQTWLDIEEVRQARAEERREARAARPRPLPEPGYDSYLDYSTYPYYGYGYWPATGPDYRPGSGRDQIYALHTLDLLGPRPTSINSSPHQARVYRSQFLPIVPPAPPPLRPAPAPR